MIVFFVEFGSLICDVAFEYLNIQGWDMKDDTELVKKDLYTLSQRELIELVDKEYLT